MFSEEDISVRATSFYVMQATTRCWSCRGQTRVIGFALAPGCELREWEHPAKKASAPWVPLKEPTTAWWLNYVAPNVVTHAQSICSRYRLDYSSKLKVRYWMNHCELCGVKM